MFLKQILIFFLKKTVNVKKISNMFCKLENYFIQKSEK